MSHFMVVVSNKFSFVVADNTFKVDTNQNYILGMTQ